LEQLKETEGSISTVPEQVKEAIDMTFSAELHEKRFSEHD